jgi:hypothetical protein
LLPDGRQVSRGLASVVITAECAVFVAGAALSRGEEILEGDFTATTQTLEKESGRFFAPIAGARYRAMRDLAEALCSARRCAPHSRRERGRCHHARVRPGKARAGTDPSRHLTDTAALLPIRRILSAAYEEWAATSQLSTWSLR